MRKISKRAIIISVVVFWLCLCAAMFMLVTRIMSRSDDTALQEYAQQIAALTAQLDQQDADNAQLTAELAELITTLDTQAALAAELTAALAASDALLAEANAFAAPFWPLPPGVFPSEAGVRRDLMANNDFLLDFLGGTGVTIIEREIFVVSPGLVLAAVHTGIGSVTALLEYTTHNSEIFWLVRSHSGSGFARTDMRFEWELDGQRSTVSVLRDPLRGPAQLLSAPAQVRIYRHNDWDDYEYFEAAVSADNWSADMIALLHNYTGLRARDLWFDGSRLYVDFTFMDARIFNWGSFGSAMHVMTLLDSLATLPGVETIRVLIDGAADIEMDHSCFVGYFRVTADGGFERGGNGE